MRLTQVRDFVAIAETGSIRAAARKLGVSQPAISKSLRSLESGLHVHLVQRTPQGIVLTASGRAFFARARVAHSELRKAEDEAAQAGHGSARWVAFGAGPAAAYLVVPEAVASFREQFPEARVRIVEGFQTMLMPMVREETLDFAIGVRPEGKLDAALAFRPLFRHQFVIAGRKGHPLRNARSLKELSKADWIIHNPWRGPGGALDRAFSLAGLSLPSEVVRCESYNAAIGLLERADFLGLISHWDLARPSARDSLVHIKVAEALPAYTAGVFTRVEPPLTKPATAMIRAVAAAARALARSL